RAIANAGIVIVNGAGYDNWALNLISASNNPNRRVLNVQNAIGLAGQSDLNPHFWYSPYYVNKTVNAMYKTIITIDPNNAPYYRQQYAALNASLWQSYMHREVLIKQ